MADPTVVMEKTEIDQQAIALQKQQEEIAAQKAAYEQEQTKLVQLQEQYIPKVGRVNPVYEKQYQEQFGKVQQQYKGLSGGIEQYGAAVEKFNVGVERFNIEAKEGIEKLNLAPTSQEDIKYAEQLAEKGYISPEDLTSYKASAHRNIEAKQELAKLDLTPESMEDITFAEGLFGKGFITEQDLSGYRDIATQNIEAEKQYELIASPSPPTLTSGGKQYVLVTGRMQARTDPDALVTGEWRKDLGWTDASWQLVGSEGTDRWSRFSQVPGLPDPSSLAKQRSEYVSPEAAQIRATEAAIRAERAGAMATFGGTFSPEMEKLAQAPVGSIVDPTAYAKSLGATPEDLAKISMLQSPTAQWATKEEFSTKLGEVTAKGFVVPAPSGTLLLSTPEQRLAEKALFEAPPVITQKETEQFLPTFAPYADQLKEKPELKLSPETLQKMAERKEQAEATKWWSGLSPAQKLVATADVLIKKPISGLVETLGIKDTGKKLIESPLLEFLGDPFASPMEGITLKETSIGEGKEKVTTTYETTPLKEPESRGFRDIPAMAYKTLDIEQRAATQKLLGRPETLTESAKLGLITGAPFIGKSESADLAAILLGFKAAGAIVPKLTGLLGSEAVGTKLVQYAGTGLVAQQVGQAGIAAVTGREKEAATIALPLIAIGAYAGKGKIGEAFKFEEATGIKSFREILPRTEVKEFAKETGETAKAAGKYAAKLVEPITKPISEFAAETGKTFEGIGQYVKELPKPPIEDISRGISKELAKPTVRAESVKAVGEVVGEIKTDITKEFVQPTRGKEALVAAKEVVGEFGAEIKKGISQPTKGKESVRAVGELIGDLDVALRSGIKSEFTEIKSLYERAPYRPPIKTAAEVAEMKKLRIREIKPSAKEVKGEEILEKPPVESIVEEWYGKSEGWSPEQSLINLKQMSRVRLGKPSEPTIEVIPKEWYGKSTEIGYGGEFSRVGIGGARTRIVLPSELAEPIKYDLSVPEVSPRPEVFPYGRSSEISRISEAKPSDVIKDIDSVLAKLAEKPEIPKPEIPKEKIAAREEIKEKLTEIGQKVSPSGKVKIETIYGEDWVALDPKSAGTEVYRILDNGKLIADITTKIEGEKGVIPSLLVSPELQGRGIGAKIVKVAEQNLAKRGVKVIELEQVLPDAEPFWSKHGYKLTDRIDSKGKPIWEKKLEVEIPKAEPITPKEVKPSVVDKTELNTLLNRKLVLENRIKNNPNDPFIRDNQIRLNKINEQIENIRGRIVQEPKAPKVEPIKPKVEPSPEVKSIEEQAKRWKEEEEAIFGRGIKLEELAPRPEPIKPKVEIVEPKVDIIKKIQERRAAEKAAETGKEIDTGMGQVLILKTEVARPIVEPPKVKTAEEIRIEQLKEARDAGLPLSQKDLAILEKSEGKITEPQLKVTVEKTITKGRGFKELEKTWAERELSLGEEAKGGAQLTKEGQILITKQVTKEVVKPKEEKLKPISFLRIEQPEITLISTKEKTKLREKERIKEIEKEKPRQDIMFAISTEQLRAPDFLSQISQVAGQKTKEKEVSILIPKFKEDIVSVSGIKLGLKEKIRQVEIQKEKQIQKERQIEKQIQREESKLLSLPKLKPKEERAKSEPKEKRGYIYKPRESPIFGGAEKIFLGKPVSPIESQKRKTKETKESKKLDKKESFDFGFKNEEKNLKSEKKSKDTNKESKNKFWET